MSKFYVVILFLVCLLATAIGIYLIGGIDPEQLQVWLESMGILAPIVYILLYTLATLLILPSTPLNLCGGALFGVWWGTFWTTLAAIIAAIIAFAFTRTIGQDYVSRKFMGQRQALDAELKQGGLFYIFAIRLFPIIPYGIINFVGDVVDLLLNLKLQLQIHID